MELNPLAIKLNKIAFYALQIQTSKDSSQIYRILLSIFKIQLKCPPGIPKFKMSGIIMSNHHNHQNNKFQNITTLRNTLVDSKVEREKLISNYMLQQTKQKSI